MFLLFINVCLIGTSQFSFINLWTIVVPNFMSYIFTTRIFIKCESNWSFLIQKFRQMLVIVQFTTFYFNNMQMYGCANVQELTVHRNRFFSFYTSKVTAESYFVNMYKNIIFFPIYAQHKNVSKVLTRKIDENHCNQKMTEIRNDELIWWQINWLCFEMAQIQKFSSFQTLNLKWSFGSVGNITISVTDSLQSWHTFSSHYKTDKITSPIIATNTWAHVTRSVKNWTL